MKWFYNLKNKYRVLIAVGVALDTFKQIESQLVSRTYSKGRKGRRRWKALF